MVPATQRGQRLSSARAPQGLLTGPPIRGLLLSATYQPESSLNNDVLPYVKPFHAFPIAAGITSPFPSVAPGPTGAALPRPAHDPMLCSVPSGPLSLPHIMEVPHLTFCPATRWGRGQKPRHLLLPTVVPSNDHRGGCLEPPEQRPEHLRTWCLMHGHTGGLFLRLSTFFRTRHTCSSDAQRPLLSHHRNGPHSPSSPPQLVPFCTLGSRL